MGLSGIGLLCLCLCCAIPTPTGQLVNVATGKTYKQSSIAKTLRNSPSYAANGNEGGTYSDDNCIHTDDNDYTPWWQVDLGRKYSVSNVTLWARTDYINRLYPLNITVDGQLCVRATSNNNRKQSLACTSAIYGQVVRLTRDYRRSGRSIWLNLCEVQIWVCQDSYYRTGSICIRCSSGCPLRQCDPVTGKCTLGCIAGWYGDRCDSRCSTKTPRCSQCAQDGGQCTVCLAGWYGDRCDLECSTKTPRCSQCVQDGEHCTVCSGHFKPPGCTACEDAYYNTNATCVQCSNCFNRQCDPDSGKCTLGCPVGFYGDTCVSRCSEKIPQCSQCVRVGGQCTVCSGHFKPPECTGVGTETLEEEKEKLVGPVVGAVVGSIVGVGLIALIVMAVLCWRLKSTGSARNTYDVEMSSSVPVNNLHDSAITGPDTPPPVPSRSGVHRTVYVMTENDRHRNNGPSTRQVAPPPASSSAVREGNVYEISEDDIETENGRRRQVTPSPASSSAGDEDGVDQNETQQRNIYDRLSPYANDDRDREPYTKLRDVTVPAP